MQSSVKAIEQAASFYCRDLEALSEEQILASVNGARKPVDFTYEVALINRRIAARFCGAEPPPSPEGDAWWVAPEELQSKQAIIAYMRSACDELLSAANSIPEEESGRMVGAPGSERPAFALANLAAMHTMYHDAQLNFIQSMNGDMAMHWS
jgi:hypothetical protein